jgi:hypothetical protein
MTGVHVPRELLAPCLRLIVSVCFLTTVGNWLPFISCVAIYLTVFWPRSLSRAAAGTLLPARVRQWRTSRQWSPQVLTNGSVQSGWVGMSVQIWKRALRIFAHACTCPDISYTCPDMPKHACTCPNISARPWNRLLGSTSDGPNTFPRLRFGLVSRAADGPFLTACGIARRIMESRIQLAHVEAASAAFSAKRCYGPSFRTGLQSVEFGDRLKTCPTRPPGRVHWEGCVVSADQPAVSPPLAARRRADVTVRDVG